MFHIIRPVLMLLGERKFSKGSKIFCTDNVYGRLLCSLC